MASISHRELRIGLLDIDGKESCTHSVRLAAERIGASPLIDCMLLSRAIDELLNFPDLSIAVKISPQSAIASFWWSQVFARLEANTTIGPRLLIQISGSSPLPPIGEVTRFFDVARSLGCRLAFDDFGIDHRSIREAVALGPDAIRIPPVFLKRATRGGRDLMIFKQLFGLASAISGLVIVDGVDDEEASNIAAKAGATFQQGRFHGAPTQIRSWGSSYRDTTALRQVSADHAIIPGRPAIPLALS
jgi:EAL domain-containing protein (putative c-di-GMP-specific phosphodiesterase class I)